MEQLFMFEMAPERAAVPHEDPRPFVRRVRRDYGPAPKQREMRIKLMRKIAFKRRYHERPGVGNDHDWSYQAAVKMHEYLLQEWEEHFPHCSNLRDQFDYWSWMLGSREQAFSFHDCLVIGGFRPEETIEALERRAPSWFLAIRDLPDAEKVAALNKLVAEQGLQTISARKAA